MNTRIALLLSIVLAVAAAIGVQSWLENERQKYETQYEKVPIMVAKRPIKAGTTLKREVLSSRDVAKTLITADMIHVNEWRRYVGMVANRTIPQGEAVLKDYVIDPASATGGAGELVKEGMRAVSIRVDQVKVVGYLVQPGDYVDILGTFDVVLQNEGQRGQRQRRTVCLLEGVKVLAVDQRTEDLAPQDSSLGTSRPYRSLTVEVTPLDGARLINAQNEGDLHLMLRSRANATDTVLQKGGAYRWDQDFAGEEQ